MPGAPDAGKSSAVTERSGAAGGDRPEKQYTINEVFYSLQGEGARAGSANVFVRFAACNLRCNVEEHGFDCDTDFSSGARVSGSEVAAMAIDVIADSLGSPPSGTDLCRAGVIFTGGEPALSLDDGLLDAFEEAGFARFAIETNGTKPLGKTTCERIGHICCSPKSAWHTIRIERIDELRVVRAEGVPLPKIPGDVKDNLMHPATGLYVSPAFSPEGLDMRTLRWCIKLVKESPAWKLSLQMHKVWQVR